MTTTMKLSVIRNGVTTEHSMNLEDHVEEDINYFIRFYAKQCAIEIIEQIMKDKE